MLLLNCKKKYRHYNLDKIIKKYSKDSKSNNQIMNQTEMFRNANKSLPEETVVERVERKRKKQELQSKS